MPDTTEILTDPYLVRIVRLTREAIGPTPTRGYLFGSRATGRAAPGSDYDIAVEGDGDIEAALSRARIALEDSTIPFTVDVVDLSAVDERFRASVLREGIRLWGE